MSHSKEHSLINKYWFEIASNARRSKIGSIGGFKADFGVSPCHAEVIYRHIGSLPRRYILYGLYFIKNYPTDIGGARAFGLGSIHTWRQHSRTALFEMERLLPKVPTLFLSEPK
jgi:hypothetical protein